MITARLQRHAIGIQMIMCPLLICGVSRLTYPLLADILTPAAYHS